MAYKMVISESDVLFNLSSNFQVGQKLIPDTTLNIAAGPNGEVFLPQVSMQGAAGTKANGYMAVELFDKDDNSIVEVSFKGKIGADFYGNMLAHCVLQLKVGASDVVGTVNTTAVQSNCEVTMSPTTFSTGKLKLTFSGNLPASSIMYGNCTLWSRDANNPTISSVGQITPIKQGVSGHAEAIITFSVVSV